MRTCPLLYYYKVHWIGRLSCKHSKVRNKTTSAELRWLIGQRALLINLEKEGTKVATMATKEMEMATKEMETVAMMGNGRLQPGLDVEKEVMENGNVHCSPMGEMPIKYKKAR